jgi:hypothetical protein
MCQQASSNLETFVTVGRERLPTAELGVIRSVGSNQREHAPVGIEVDQRDLHVMEPPDGIQADRAGVADDGDALDASIDATESANPATVRDAVLEHQVPSLDRYTESVPGEDEYGGCGGARLTAGLGAGECHRGLTGQG